MAAAKYNLQLEQGGDFLAKLTFKDASGNPFDFLMDPGWQAQAQIRSSAGEDVTVLASFDTSFTPDVSSVPQGELVLSMARGAVDAIPLMVNRDPLRKVTTYAWDLFLIDTTGKRVRYLEGIVEISPAVTEE